MSDFRAKDPQNMYFPELKESVQTIKNNKEVKATMCEAVENYGKKKKEEGREEGRVEILRDVANSVIPLFQKKTLSLEDACGITKMTEEEFLALVAKN